MSGDLWAAVATGDVDAARTLLQQPGVDVDAYDVDGATLTYVAAAHGHTAMVEMLADEAASLLDRPLRLGVTGLARSGKTVFTTAIARALLFPDRLPFLQARADGRLPDRFEHAEWITLHDNPFFRDFVGWLVSELDRVGPTLNDDARARVEDLFRRAVAAERAFFDAAYQDNRD